MSKNSNINRLLDTINHKKVDRVPHLENWINKTTVEYILNRTVKETTFRYDSGNATKTYLNPEDYVEYALKIGQDAVCFGFDWSMGWIWAKASNGTDHYIDGKYKTWDSIKNLHFPETETIFSQYDNYYRIIEKTNLGLYPCVSSVFDTTYHAVGFADFMYKIHDDLNFIEHLMDFNMEFYRNISLELCKRYDNIPIVLIADDIAGCSGLFIDEKLFRKLYIHRLNKIIEPFKERKIPIIFHTDGKLDRVLPILIECGINCLHPIEPYCNNIYELKEKYQDKIAFFGNIDTVKLAYDSLGEIEEDIKRHCDKLKHGYGYVLGSSSSIFDGIPPENFMAMINYAHKYGRY